MTEQNTPIMPEAACKQALTMVFIENQQFGEQYEPDTAFMRGTVFPDLDKPLEARGVGR